MPQDEFASTEQGQTSNLQGENGGDHLTSCYDYLRKSLQGDRTTPRTPCFASEEKAITQWARRVGLLLEDLDFLKNFRKGGQEHDIFLRGDRMFKLTKHRVFGLTAGIDLALVASGQEARRFHLWEATPLQYIQRLLLQNYLVPRLNRLEGVVKASANDLAIITSQPYFEHVPVNQAEIDQWFDSLGFIKVTSSGYYRKEDNLGIFDAHDKNLFRDGDILIPFDVIPCHPEGGFLTFIEESIQAGHRVESVRSSSIL